MKEVVRVWIGKPNEDGKFNGTAFFIDAQTLVTAKHVVTNREGMVYDNIFLGNTPDGGIPPVDEVVLCDRDVAILKVKKSFNIEGIPFTKKINEGNDVILVGFYDNDSSQKTYQNRISGYQSSEHTYELQNHLTNGLSGSPVLLEGKICGVAKAINIKKNLTYVIPISELCMETAEFFKEKGVEKKKLSLEQWASIATIGATLIALGAWLISPIEPIYKEEPIPIEVQETQQLLEGYVADMKGQFLEEVEVWENQTGSSVESNESGYYVFKNIEGKNEEELEVSFSKEGYFDKTITQQLGGKHNVFLQKKVD